LKILPLDPDLSYKGDKVVKKRDPSVVAEETMGLYKDGASREVIYMDEFIPLKP